MPKALLSLVVFFVLLAAHPARAGVPENPDSEAAGDESGGGGSRLLGIDTSYDPLGREADAVVPLAEGEGAAARAPASGRVIADEARSTQAAPAPAAPAAAPEPALEPAE